MLTSSSKTHLYDQHNLFQSRMYRSNSYSVESSAKYITGKYHNIVCFVSSRFPSPLRPIHLNVPTRASFYDPRHDLLTRAARDRRELARAADLLPGDRRVVGALEPVEAEVAALADGWYACQF